MIRCREGQLRIANLEAPTLEIEQAARASEIVQQMAVDMEQVGIIAWLGDDMLIPNLGQHRPGLPNTVLP